MPHRMALFCRLVSVVSVLLAMPACSLFDSRGDKVEAADTQLQLGVRYMSMDKLAIAKQHLERSVDLNSKNVEAHNALAFLYEKLNDEESARESYEYALKLDAEDLSVLNNFGRFLCERGEYQEGMAYLEKAVRSPLNNRQWLAATNAGRCALTQKKSTMAEAYLRQALQRQPNYAPALQAMQKLSYQNGDYWAAKGFYERYSNVSRQSAEALWYAYQTERALGNQEIAERYKSQLMESFPLAEETQRIYSTQEKLKHGK
ncbi:type IV pilus biogenesis/stability protein PilW [Methylotuvimicrobium buryatense]|uniref:type IV pilus biogenesis/stability protein PilW n=1 Tax=Methylotuvimicrobium buryatense TaxID=95641 RepID=UPI001F1CD6BE|nr:type IV pilus biogenesis/stability protein PilW [Methylotuvimicrobium buryatense]